MRTSALFGAKNFGLFKIYGVSAPTRVEGMLSQCGHFADKGEGGQFFTILCGRLLWTAPKNTFVNYCKVCWCVLKACAKWVTRLPPIVPLTL